MKYLIVDTEDYTLGEINDYFKSELSQTNLNKEDIVIEKSLQRKIAIQELERIFDENGMSHQYEMLGGVMHLNLTGNAIEFSENEFQNRFEDAYTSILNGLIESV